MIALYARVSTDDQGQDVETQLLRLREAGARLAEEGETIWELADHASAADDRGRVQWRKLLDRCRGGRRPRLLVVVRLDRAFRSLRDAILTVDELKDLGVGFKCLDGDVDTSTAQGRLGFHMLAAFAEFEREMIRIRVKDGMARARAHGAPIGKRGPDKKPRKKRRDRV